MELTLFLTTLALIFKFGLAVKCYSCAPQWKDNNTHLCHQFDNSDKFMINCKNSTLCSKKEVFMDFGNGKATRAVTRGCAPQTLRDEQRLINGSWQYVYAIHEVYEEKCHEDKTYDERTTNNLYCYCRGDLCNGARGVGMGFQYLSTISIGFSVLWRFFAVVQFV